jgi:adenylyltransferase/sulfurtransferase
MIPSPLRPYAGKRDSAEFSAGTVGEALGHLTTEFAELRKHLFTEDGKLRSFVNVYVNDEDIRYLAKENTPTKDGDTISIIPSIAGGVTFSGAVAVPGRAALNFARNLWSLIVPPRRIGI